MANIPEIPSEIIDKIITSDPTRILTNYYKLTNKLIDKSSMCYKKNKKRKLSKTKNTFKNPMLEYLQSPDTIKRIFNNSSWFKLFINSYSYYKSPNELSIDIRNRQLKINYLDIIRFIKTKYKHLAGFLQTHITIPQHSDIHDHDDHVDSVDATNCCNGISDDLDIIIEIENNLDMNKLDIAMEKIGKDIVDVLHPMYILWLVLISSILPCNPCSRITIGSRITDKLFNESFDCYISKNVLPLVTINFNMGYQFIIAWDNMASCIFGYIWGGSSGNEYEYYQMQMNNYCKNDKINRNRIIGSKRDNKILEFLKSISSISNHTVIIDDYFQHAINLSIL